MRRALSLDDLTLFLAVADAGGLGGAARATGASAPTLSRRMAELERQVGARLFERGARGYALTAAGRGLLEEAEALRPVAARLARWEAGARQTPRVRISAGSFTSRRLALGLGRVWAPGDGWLPELLASNARLDLARREADIGIRNGRPDQPWLAGRRTGTVRYAVYAAPGAPEGFVALADAGATTPSQRWLAANHGDAIVTRASDARLMLDLALAGVGQVVLPTFAGDDLPGLVRRSEVIAALSHEEWLVAHHDARHDPPVRAALDALTRLLTDARPG